MNLELEVKASYPAPGISDEDVNELELSYVRSGLRDLLGDGVQMHITLRYQGKDGIWKTLRS